MNKYQELVKEAKTLGINTKGMKQAQVEEAIAKHNLDNVVVVIGGNAGDVIDTLTELKATTEGEAPTEQPADEKVERRGRPVVAGCARQQRLASYEAKREEGLEVKRGRPVDTNSERYKRLEAIRLKKEAGEVIKRGRPAAPKAEPKVEVVIKGEEITVEVDGTPVNEDHIEIIKEEA